MLDIHTRQLPGRAPVRDVAFLRIELCPLAEGRVHMSMTATTLDDQGPELLDQEVACDKVATIDDVLALIRARVTFVARTSKMEH